MSKNPSKEIIKRRSLRNRYLKDQKMKAKEGIQNKENTVCHLRHRTSFVFLRKMKKIITVT